jgi:hypothetical protein
MVLLRSLARGTNRRSVFSSRGRSSERGRSLRSRGRRGTCGRSCCGKLTRGGEWWRSFCSLARAGACGCSCDSNVVCGDEGRRFCSIARGRKRGCRFASLAGGGECGCSCYGSLARGGARGRSFRGFARRRERYSFQSVAGTCVSSCISTELLNTVVLGKQMLDEEVIGQTARSRAEPLPPALDLAQSVVAALDRARLSYIEAPVVLKTGFKRAAVI